MVLALLSDMSELLHPIVLAFELTLGSSQRTSAGMTSAPFAHVRWLQLWRRMALERLAETRDERAS